MRRLFTVLFVATPLFCWADTKPFFPKVGPDMVQPGNKSAREYFEGKQKDATCLKDLDAAKKASLTKAEKLATLKKQKESVNKADIAKLEEQLDAAEEDLFVHRKEVLKLIQECGVCTAENVVKEQVETASKTQTWFISSGYCQLPTPTKETETLAAAFETLSESLIESHKYPRSRGGFANILRFDITKPNGIVELATNKFPTNPVSLFVSVLGPDTFLGNLAFNYFVEAKYKKEAPASGPKEFVMSFQTAKKPRGFKPPTIEISKASGKPGKLIHMPLTNLKGQWYVNSDGLIHYWTAAEFPDLDLDLSEGLRIQLDTLVKFVERVGQ